MTPGLWISDIVVAFLIALHPTAQTVRWQRLRSYLCSVPSKLPFLALMGRLLCPIRMAEAGAFLSTSRWPEPELSSGRGAGMSGWQGSGGPHAAGAADPRGLQGGVPTKGSGRLLHSLNRTMQHASSCLPRAHQVLTLLRLLRAAKFKAVRVLEPGQSLLEVIESPNH